MQYHLTNQDGTASLSVFYSNGEQKVIAGNHPNFAAIVTHLVGPKHDENLVKGLVDPAVGIGREMAKITDRVTFDLYNLYLDGQKVDGFLSNEVKRRLLAQDQDWARLIKFLLNVDANPSMHAQKAVYQWVANNGLTITEDGNFIGYKATAEDGYSSHSGPNNWVDGVLYRNGDTVRVPHAVGSVISKKRADVDDRPGGGCSVGLHVGTEAYARGFGPRLVTVEVNPADVVSAPDHNLEIKIRVCRYKVVAMADPAQFANPSWDPAPDEQHDEVGAPPDLSDDEQVEWAREHPVKSREHEFSVDEEQDDRGEYDSLTAAGRTLYDNLRTQFDWPHDEAFDASLDEVARLLDESDEEPEVEEAAEEPQDDDRSKWTLADYAANDEALQRDLQDPNQGHKALGRKYAGITTESSVRRWRKANGVSTSFGSKVRDAVS